MAENKNIVGLLFKNGTIADICNKVTGGAALTKDFIQEIVVILLSKPAKVDEMNESGMLLAYIHGIAKNQWNSSTSPFYTKYKKYNVLKKDNNEGLFEPKGI